MLIPLLAPSPIALERRVATVDAVVRELAQKSGQSLRIEKSLADEVLFVGLKPRPAGDLMSLVARAASAEWVRDGDRIVLGRSAGFWRRKAREEQAADAAALKASLAAFLVKGDATVWPNGFDPTAPMLALSKPADGEAWGRYQRRSTALSPLGRLLSRALRVIPLADLAALPPGAAVRYVPRPNRLQRPLPPTADFAQYLVEREALQKAVARLPQPRQDALNGMVSSWLRDPGASEGVPLLQFRREADGAVQIVARVVGPAGPAVDLAMLTLPVSPDHPGAAVPGYADWKDRPVAVTGATASFVHGLTDGRVDPAEAARLRDPVANEPIAALMAEPIDALTKAAGGEAVVALPDETAHLAGGQLEQNPKLGEFADGLAKAVTFETEGGLLVGRARRPTFSAAMKTSRTNLRDLLRLGAAGLPRLDAVARYTLAQNPDAGESGFETVTLHGAGLTEQGFAGGGLAAQPYRDALRLLASLAPAERETLSAGRSLPIARLAAQSQTILQTLVFGHLVDTEFRRPPMFSNNFDPTLAAEGLAPDASLAFESVERKPVATTPGAYRPMEARELGSLLEDQENGGSLSPGYPNVAKDRFLLCSQTTFALAIRVSEELGLHLYFSDFEVAPETQSVPYSELPPDFAKAIRQAHDDARKRRSAP